MTDRWLRDLQAWCWDRVRLVALGNFLSDVRYWLWRAKGKP